MSPFRSTAFRWLWCSSLALAGAQLMERVATNWLALEAGGGPLAVGIVLAARSLPSLLFGLPMGTLADRRDRRSWLVGVSAAATGLALGFWVLAGRGNLTLWPIAGVAFLAGCLQVADVPARQALIVDTVGRDAAPGAIAWNAVASRFFGAVGALAGGIAIPLVGIANCYALVASAYFIGLILLVVLRPPVPTERATIRRLPFRVALGGAMRLIVSHPAVRTLVLAAMACEIFGFSYLSAVPSLARDVLLAGPEGLGILSSASSFGSTIAVLGLAVLTARRGAPREALLAADYLLYGAAIIALGLAPSLPFAVIAMLVVGGCSAAFDALQQTLLQLAVPEEQRGRAAGIWVFSIGTAPAGHLEIGVLASSVGPSAALLANGALVVLGALTLAWRAPSYRPAKRLISE